MKETHHDIQDLQTLLTNSMEQAGDFLRSSFEMPDKSLSAQQVISYFCDVKTVSVATVTQKGAPRVAPTAAVFYRGRFYIPTVANAARTKMLTNNPAVSLNYYCQNDVAVIIHGTASILRENHAYFADLEAIQREYLDSSPRDWGEGVYLRIEPDVMYTYARYPDEYPESTPS